MYALMYGTRRIMCTLIHTVQLSPGDGPAVQLCLHEVEKETHPTIITRTSALHVAKHSHIIITV